jgi:Asp-tRNA(Asn)/Glu-tRNA(Gln) amidotransferase A subunit family amidase
MDGAATQDGGGNLPFADDEVVALVRQLGDADAAAAIAVSAAPRCDGDEKPRFYTSYLDVLTSAAGWPSAIMPFTTDGGLPVGLIVIARPNREDAIISALRQLDDTGIPMGYVSPPWTGWES